MSSAAHRAEHLVLGRYDVGPAIGRGATAVVHRGLDRATGEEVAVKVVPVELGIDERVDIEARAAGRLDHPGIVALRDAGRDAECLYLISDLVDGPSLAAALRAPEPPGDAALIRIGAEVLDALAHAHERGLAHRDFKPANILLSSAGRARLADFGVAR
ncbi:MAG: serine/threonine-protein kinase, partial [Miltoncostaeaceae bacterium]